MEAAYASGSLPYAQFSGPSTFSHPSPSFCPTSHLALSIPRLSLYPLLPPEEDSFWFPSDTLFTRLFVVPGMPHTLWLCRLVRVVSALLKTNKVSTWMFGAHASFSGRRCRIHPPGAKLGISWFLVHIFFLWRCGPTRAMPFSFKKMLDHTQRRAIVGRTPLDEWSARRRDLYLTTRNIHNKHPCCLAGFEPTVLAGERPQTHALDRAATGIGISCMYGNKKRNITDLEKIIINFLLSVNILSTVHWNKRHRKFGQFMVQLNLMFRIIWSREFFGIIISHPPTPPPPPRGTTICLH